jgi:hypothetical protein
MTTSTQGPWMRAPNLSAEAVGSIHDDEQAKSLGFKGALIGGSVLCSFFETTLVDLFGRDWYERGFFKQSFIAPIYEVDDFRVVATEVTPTETDERLVEIGLEKQSGERGTAGYAGLATPGSMTVPWERERAREAPDLGDPMPDQPLGTVLPERTLLPTTSASAARRTASGNDSSWYETSSPWGGAIVPSFMYIFLDPMIERDGPRQPRGQMRPATAGMNGTFQLRMFGPMFCEQRYRLQSKLVEKGFSGRTAFRTLENRIEEESGRLVAVARQKIRWFAERA